MRILRITLSAIAFLFTIGGNAQNDLIDQQILKSNTRVFLFVTHIDTALPVYSLVRSSLRGTESFTQIIDSIHIVPCGGPSSIFFLNDSVGFLTQSGGCYAYYNYLHRTSDGGKTWVDVLNIIGMDLPPNLDNESFFMFDDKRGIIIWQLKNGFVEYSETSDGGKTWILTKTEIKKPAGSDILSVHFSASGQITLVTGVYSVLESDKKEATVLQSNDFGKSYRILK